MSLVTPVGIREPGQAEMVAWKGAPQVLTVVAISVLKFPGLSSEQNEIHPS